MKTFNDMCIYCDEEEKAEECIKILNKAGIKMKKTCWLSDEPCIYYCIKGDQISCAYDPNTVIATMGVGCDAPIPFEHFKKAVDLFLNGQTKKKESGWTLFKKKMPPMGVPLICSVFDHGAKFHKPPKDPYQLRYPCYYVMNTVTGSEEIFCDGKDSIEVIDGKPRMTPDIPVFLAWMEFPEVLRLNDKEEK